MLDFETSKSNSDVSKSNSNNLVKKLLLKNYVTSEGAVSHNTINLSPLVVYSTVQYGYGYDYGYGYGYGYGYDYGYSYSLLCTFVAWTAS